ncbi:hypothetical protein CPB86DRAFT_698704 [Serendipita vermifera]|nr:hypothetical protein CPB86DRAFT_698704 [Serendipita vermifera]
MGFSTTDFDQAFSNLPSAGLVVNNAPVPNIGGFTGGLPVSGLPLGIPINDATVNSGDGGPAAEFKSNIQIALNQHIPQIAALAQTVVDGIERAYHPDVNPNKTANDYAALSNLATQFYVFLRETGVGALPIFEPPQPSSDVGVNADADAMALDIISAPPLPEVTNITTMTEEQLRTSLNSVVNVQYTQQRKVAENANIVLNRLASRVHPGEL